MSSKYKLDATDIGILEALKSDGKMTVKNLSQRLKLSPTPIYERIKKMEKAGVIQNYTINIDEKLVGKKLIAFAHISLQNHTKALFRQLQENLLAIPEITEVHAVSGSTDFIIKILVEDMDAYKDFIMEKLFEVENIGRVESFISLSMEKN
jgi:DNA-binding Lrp family transcriptional regulator